MFRSGRVAEDLEREIEAMLKSIPEYAEFPGIHFYVQTNNAFERINFMEGTWSTLLLDQASGATVLAFSTGWGDGVYSVFAHEHAETLTAIDVPFMDDPEAPPFSGQLEA